VADFEFDPDWITEELFESEDLIEILEDMGAALTESARSIAGQYNRTGQFQASIQGSIFKSSNGRPYYRVWSDDPAAYSIEFGTAKDAPHRVLGRAIGKWSDAMTHNGEVAKRRRNKQAVEKGIREWADRVRRQ
jgi:hypothetical protein